MKIDKTIILFLMPMLFLSISALAIDLEDFGDFSSRSLIMNKYSEKNILSQEQKDILKSRNLAPTTICLIEQIKKNKIENVRFLLDIGVNPNNQAFSEYPTYVASKYNRFEILKELINHGAKLDKGFYSELYASVKNKNTEMSYYLIENKANIHYIDSVTENTIIYEALKNKMYDVAKKLIELGIKPDIKSIKYIKKKKLYYIVEGN